MRMSALSTLVPEGRLETEEIVRAAGGSVAEARVFQRLFGMDSVSCVPEGETLAEQFEPVVDELAAVHEGETPDTLVYVRAQPLQYAAGRSPATLLANHPLLRKVRRGFEIDQYNCGGFFWALDVARLLLEGGVSRSVVVLGGDCHIGLPLGDRYVPGCTLMGDAFCGVVLDTLPGGTRVSPSVLETHPEFSRGRSGTTREMGEFFAAHGRIVKSLLDSVGFDWTGATPLLPHNVNARAWQVFCAETGLSPQRVRLGLLPDVGHCYICDPLLLLAAEPPGTGGCRAAVLLSVGMGGFAGACTVLGSPGGAPASGVLADTS